jgi:hypothetical protein
VNIGSILKELTNQEIKEFLEDAPLYSWKTFSVKEGQKRTSLLIKEIDQFCEQCKQVRPFQNFRSSGGGVGHPLAKIKYLESGTSYFEYTCASCRKEKHEFLVEQLVDETSIKIQKYGQLPRKKLERDSNLQKFFKDDAEYYEKAIISLSNGYGIAAFAYFRRIIELNINRLLDFLLDDLDISDSQSSIKTAIDDLRKESPMCDKINIANNALPDYLKPDGLNPLGRIYGILSEGVHSLSDAQCLEKAEIVQACLSFLVTELASRKRNRSHFKKLVGKM